MNYFEIRPRGIQSAVDLWNFFARQTEQEQKVDQVHDCEFTNAVNPLNQPKL